QGKKGPAEVERTVECSQCGTPTLRSQIMQIGSASLCPKCQSGYRRQAQAGFGDKPPEYAKPMVRFGVFLLDLLFCAGIGLVLVIGERFTARRFFPDNQT